MKEQLHRIVDGADDITLLTLMAASKPLPDDGRPLPHETPEFFAELEQIYQDTVSGKEESYSLEDFREKFLSKTSP